MTNHSNLKKIATLSLLVIIAIAITTLTLQLTQQSQDTRSRASQSSGTPDDDVIKDACTYDNGNNIVCPQYHSPSPDFCREGTLIFGGVDDCGCQLPPTCLPYLCWNQVTSCNDSFCWPNGCQGVPTAMACTMQLTPLSQEQLDLYQLWLDAGSPPVHADCYNDTTSDQDDLFSTQPLTVTFWDAEWDGPTPAPQFYDTSLLKPNHSYGVEVRFHIQNVIKNSTAPTPNITIKEIINGQAKTTRTILYQGVMDHRDGWSDTFVGSVFTVNEGTNQITVEIDPDNQIAETNENNNTTSYSWTTTQAYSPFDLNQDDTINLLDYNLFLNGWLDTLK